MSCVDETGFQIMSALRVQTADLHEQVERRVNVDWLTHSRDNYVRLLVSLYGFYRPFDDRMNGRWPQAFPIGYEPRAERLMVDLHRLGLGNRIATLPQCGALPTLETLPSIIGAAYVVEGAALGGKIISRLVRERLGIDPSSGGAFFAGADDVGARWRLFRTAVDSMIQSTSERDGAVDIARETFLAFDGWLSSCELV